MGFYVYFNYYEFGFFFFRNLVINELIIYCKEKDIECGLFNGFKIDMEEILIFWKL